MPIKNKTKNTGSLRTALNALLFLTGFVFLPHVYASYFVSVISHGDKNPIDQYIDAGYKIYVAAYLAYAFLPKTIREIKFFNFLYFLVIYAVLMFLYLKFAPGIS